MRPGKVWQALAVIGGAALALMGVGACASAAGGGPTTGAGMAPAGGASGGPGALRAAPLLWGASRSPAHDAALSDLGLAVPPSCVGRDLPRLAGVEPAATPVDRPRIRSPDRSI
jgi:hypothetical protein